MGLTPVPNNRQTVRLGLIGAGRWGRAYIRTLAELDGLSLKWVSSRNPETKTFVPDTCSVTEDWRDLMTAENIDGIIVATPPASHAEIALTAIEQGHAVMVEKPLTLSLQEAEHLLEVGDDGIEIQGYGMNDLLAAEGQELLGQSGRRLP